jgi:hypothetical protein
MRDRIITTAVEDNQGPSQDDWIWDSRIQKIVDDTSREIAAVPMFDPFMDKRLNEILDETAKKIAQVPTYDYFKYDKDRMLKIFKGILEDAKDNLEYSVRREP